MDAIQFWKEQTDIFNDTNYCGRCWDFAAPLSEELANQQQFEDKVLPKELPEDEDVVECCAKVIITDYRKSTTPRYNPRTSLLMTRDVNHSMSIYFVIPDGGKSRNVYNEILGHPIEESKWKMFIQPLDECITDELLVMWCEVFGTPVEVVSWSVDYVTEWLNDYVGIKVNMNFREKQF